MFSHLRKSRPAVVRLAQAIAAIVCALTTVPSAIAGSIQQPGLTTGLAEGFAPEEGLYSVSLMNYGGFSTAAGGVNSGTLIPSFVTWSTPLTIGEGRIMIKAAPFVLAHVDSLTVKRDGLYRSYVGVWSSWFLGHGFNFAIGEGVQTGLSNALARDLGRDFTAFQQNVALSYVRDNLNLTANGFYTTGNTDRAASQPSTFNLDLTATKKSGRAEYGLVAYGQWDLNRPSVGYGPKQEELAVGALFGYLIGNQVSGQLKVTHTVYERNVGGRDTRGWVQLIVPLYTPPAPVPYNADTGLAFSR